MLKFYWNGIKVNGGKLQLCSYSGSQLCNHPAGTITIYGKRYRSFSAEIHAALKVENNSEMQTDYFENDRIRVQPDHPLYTEAKAALVAAQAHDNAVWAKQLQRSESRQAA